ncbi:MAG: adenylate/guanylate cyclase domain-containing protein [Desulfobacterales bacterium]|jgi:class 3 adenylate cyclase/tetratricopeptide (TPR) repeat protein
MICPNCEYENREGARFCKKCGTQLEQSCPSCGHPYQLDSLFCDECGHNLKPIPPKPPIDYTDPQSYTPKFLAEKILNTRSTIEGERKRVTVLFADVANYTAISEKLDPEEIHHIMDGCFKMLMDEIHRYEGTINQFTGDGAMALFGAPVAHEDHAQRACYAALSIQKAIAGYREKIKKSHEIDFRLRFGLNSGPVLVGSIGDDLRMDYTAVGDTTNLAARIQQAAVPGEVWMSRETHNMIRHYFHDRLVGELPLKGKAQPHPIYCLLSERSGVRTRFEASLVRGVTELVGRRLEMEALREAFNRVKDGDAQVVDVVGEAGVGKSRLVYEFRETFVNDMIFLSGICVHYGRNINFLPVIDVVRKAFDIEGGMTAEDVARQIDAKATDDLAPMIPFYKNLLSLTVDDPKFGALNPEGRKFGTFEAVKNLLLDLSAEKPLVVFLEDAHWMDKISEEFFTYFSRSLATHPILLLAAYRPEAVSSWAQGAHYQRLVLETLSSNSSARLIRNILAGIDLEPRIEQKIVEKAGGNPLFVEEIVRELLERGDLSKAGERYTSQRHPDQLEIPSTVQGILAARMDRLSEDLKKTMQIASVIGRDFAFRLLKSIMQLGDELRVHLTHLVGLEIMYEKALYPELEYIFKHALAQEVAYESLLKQRRKEIHGRIARAVEELYAHQLEEHYELLAYHYERSGDELKAVDYLTLAGEKSNKRGAAQAAYEFFDKAFGMTEDKNMALDSEKEIRLYQGRSEASFKIGAIGKCVADSRKAMDLSRQHNLIDYERESISGLSLVMYLWSDKAEAERVFQEGIARAREMGDKALESYVLAGMGIRAAMDGQPYKGNQIIMEAEKMARALGDPKPILYTRVNRSTTERWIGRPQKTIELTEGVLELTREMFNVSALTYIISFRGLALAEVGRIEEAVSILNYGLDVCEKFGVSIRLGCLYNSLGYCFAEIYQTERALAFNYKGEKIARELMEKYPMGRRQYAEMAAQSSVNVMENYFDQGNLDKAWNLVNSLAEEAKSEDFDMFRHQWESRMNCLAAQILLQRNDIGQAESIIQENLRETQKKQMKKREGCFLRLLGELQIKCNEFEKGLKNLNDAIQILRDVTNPRQLWQAYSSLASAQLKKGRSSEAQQSWKAAAGLIHDVSNNLGDHELKAGFLNAKPIRDILSNAET